jgi:hypothetical protein
MGEMERKSFWEKGKLFVNFTGSNLVNLVQWDIEFDWILGGFDT